MNIVVCVNQIPDPEAPPQKFGFQPGAKQPNPWTGAFVMGPFDENALELALQLKDRTQGKVYAVSLGGKGVVPALRKAFSVKADEAVWVQVDPTEMDSSGAAELLAATIRRIPNVDVVLCGRQGGDWDAGQVGLLLAEALGFGALGLVKGIESLESGRMVVVREVDGGAERVEVRTPAVFTVTNDPGNQLRVAKVRDIMMAERRPITAVALEELGLAEAPRPRVEILGLLPPPGERRRAEFLEGQTAAEKAGRLADRLAELLRTG